MAKKGTITYEKKKAWDWFSKYIRLRDAIQTTKTKTHAKCCTCGKIYPAFGRGCLQAGHYISGRRNAYLFDEKGCHAQCYNCNINLKGNTIKYRKFLVAKFGEKEVEKLENLQDVSLQLKAFELKEIAETYKKKYLDLLA